MVADQEAQCRSGAGGQSDLELEEEEQLENGLPAEEAWYRARRAFGNATLIHERTHEAWGLVPIESLLQDPRYALRGFIRNPGFAIVALVTLALGIGANTAVFSVINAIMLRALPVRDPGQLVRRDSIPESVGTRHPVQRGHRTSRYHCARAAPPVASVARQSCRRGSAGEIMSEFRQATMLLTAANMVAQTGASSSTRFS